MLVGCKADLERSVSYLEGAQLAERLGAVFFETSAKTKANVWQVFQILALLQIRLR